jgi:nicotinate-nucleotide adenylyltransferase
MIEVARFSLIGIYGGTFDPVHFGHLRVAEELVEILQLDRLHFMPASQPRLRNSPVAISRHRVAMLNQAIHDNARFSLDDREIYRPGETYSVESLREIRQENAGNKEITFCFIVGSDAFIKLQEWYCWQELFELCHLVIVNRPGHALITDPYCLPLELRKLCCERWVTHTSELKNLSSGLVFVAPTTLLDISSTKIRTLIASGKSARYLLPGGVLDYIKMHNFYAGGK